MCGAGAESKSIGGTGGGMSCGRPKLLGCVDDFTLVPPLERAPLRDCVLRFRSRSIGGMSESINGTGMAGDEGSWDAAAADEDVMVCRRGPTGMVGVGAAS